MSFRLQAPSPVMVRRRLNGGTLGACQFPAMYGGMAGVEGGSRLGAELADDSGGVAAAVDMDLGGVATVDEEFDAGLSFGMAPNTPVTTAAITVATPVTIAATTVPFRRDCSMVPSRLSPIQELTDAAFSTDLGVGDHVGIFNGGDRGDGFNGDKLAHGFNGFHAPHVCGGRGSAHQKISCRFFFAASPPTKSSMIMMRITPVATEASTSMKMPDMY